MASDKASVDVWGSVVAELQTYRDQQQETWGDLDNTTLACYLAGETDARDTERVEAALEAHPELQNLANLVEEILEDFDEDNEATPTPSLKFEPKTTAFYNHFRQMGTLLAAACLLLVLGFALFDFNPTSTSGKSTFDYTSANLSSPEKSSTEARALAPNVELANGTASRPQLVAMLREVENDLKMGDGDLTKAVDTLDKVANAAPDEEIREEARELVVDALAKEFQVSDRSTRAFRADGKRTVALHLPGPSALEAPKGERGRESALWQNKYFWSSQQSRSKASRRGRSQRCPKLMQKGVPYLLAGAQQQKNPHLQSRCRIVLQEMVAQGELDALAKHEKRLSGDCRQLVYQTWIKQSAPTAKALQNRVGIALEETGKVFQGWASTVSTLKK